MFKKQKDKSKVGRPKLASRKVKNKSIIMIITSLILTISLIIGSFVSLNIIKIENITGNTNNAFTIKFNNKRAVNGSGTMKNQIVARGKKANINKLKYKNSGYIFRGWIMQRTNDSYYYGYDKDGNLGWYKNCSRWYYFEDQDDISNMASKGQILRLYADWTKQKDTYKIIYKNTRAKNPSGTMKNQIVSTNFSVKLRPNDYKDGKDTFTGWVAIRHSDNKTYGYDKDGNLGWYKNDGTIIKYYYFKNKQLVKNIVSPGDIVTMVAFYKNTIESYNLTLYLSPNGKDTNMGTKNNRIKTLKRAHEIIKEEASIRRIKDVKIIVGKGTYIDQTVNWTYNNEGYKIIITAENKKDMPVFKCNSDNKKTWFSLTGNDAKGKDIKLNLTISYLKVEGYFQAMSLIHGRGGTFNNITISNMHFNKIGTKYALAKQIKEKKSLTTYSPACISMGNISNSVISSNKFYYIENTIMDKYAYDFYIHALYIKTHSNNNIIKNNDFKYVSSDPIRLREGANYNKIYSNTFNRVGTYTYVSESYFPNGLDSNNSVRKEAVSIGNEFYKNILGYSYYYDDYLPYALVDEIDNKGVHDMTILSRYDKVTNEEKKVLRANKPTVIKVNNTTSSLYKEFKEHIYVHGNSYKKSNIKKVSNSK